MMVLRPAAMLFVSVSCACVLGDGRHMRRSVSAQLFYDGSLERVDAGRLEEDH